MKNNQHHKRKSQLEKHKSILKKFKIYPTSHRAHIYQTLLQIPHNSYHFTQINKTPIPDLLLPKQFPIKNKNIYKTWGIIVSLISQYLAIPIGWLPPILHGFVVVMDKFTLMQVFQVCLSVLSLFYQHVNENYPRPSNTWALILQQIITHQFPKTRQMLTKLKTTFTQQIWPSIISSLSDITEQFQWQQIWDYLITYRQRPGLLIVVSAVWGHHVMKDFKGSSSKQLNSWMKKKRILIIQKILQLSEQIHNKYKIVQRVKYRNYVPLSKIQYPIINMLPSLSLMDFLKNMKEEQRKKNQEQLKKFRCENLKNDIEFVQMVIQSKIKDIKNYQQKELEDKKHNFQIIIQENIRTHQENNQRRIQNLKQLEKKFTRDINNSEKTVELEKSKNIQSGILYQEMQWKKRMQFMQKQVQSENDKVLEIEKNTLEKLKQILDIKLHQQRQKLVK